MQCYPVYIFAADMLFKGMVLCNELQFAALTVQVVPVPLYQFLQFFFLTAGFQGSLPGSLQITQAGTGQRPYLVGVDLIDNRFLPGDHRTDYFAEDFVPEANCILSNGIPEDRIGNLKMLLKGIINEFFDLLQILRLIQVCFSQKDIDTGGIGT